MNRLTTLLALSLLSSEASAQAIRYTFEGTIQTVFVQDPDTWDSIQVGDPFSATYRVDPSVAPTLFPSSNSAQFDDLVLSVEIDIGGLTTTSLQGSSITMANNTPGGGPPPTDVCTDDFAIGAGDVGGAYISAIVVLRETVSGPSCPSSTSNLCLPLSLAPSDFTSQNEFVLFGNEGGSWRGPVTSITVVVEPGDDCAEAFVLPSLFADTAYDATGATTDGTDAAGFCDYGSFGDEQNHNDVWFTYTPAFGGCTYISTFGLAGYDTRLTVYAGASCPDDPALILACVDDELQPSGSPYEAGLDVDLVAGETYTIRLGTFDAGIAAGAGILRIAQGPGADVTSGGANPGAPGCAATDTRHVVLDYNFNGIVHAGEAGDPDATDGYRSISDRGLDFSTGVPADALLDAYQLVSVPKALDLVHLGNRTTVTGGLWAFDPGIDGDGIGTRPGWLDDLDQSGPQTTVLDPIPIAPDSVLGLLVQGTDGGGTFEVQLDFDGVFFPIITVGAPDWFGGPYPGTSFDDATSDSSLHVFERTIDLSDYAGASLTEISFRNASNANGAIAVLAAKISPGSVLGADELCNGDGGTQAGCTACPCDNDAASGTVGGCLNSNGSSARLVRSGTPFVGNDTLRFEVEGAVPNSFAVLTSGAALAPANATNPCFGLESGVQSFLLDGLRCAVQNTQRHGGRPVASDGTVGMGLTNGWGPPNGPPGGISGAAGFVDGQTRYFQVFYRELPGTVCLTEQNTTQAVRVTFFSF